MGCIFSVWNLPFSDVTIVVTGVMSGCIKRRYNSTRLYVFSVYTINVMFDWSRSWHTGAIRLNSSYCTWSFHTVNITSESMYCLTKYLTRFDKYLIKKTDTIIIIYYQHILKYILMCKMKALVSMSWRHNGSYLSPSRTHTLCSCQSQAEKSVVFTSSDRRTHT